MDSERLTKRIFLWDYQLNNNNWSSHIKTILDTSHNIVQKRVCEIDNVKKVFIEQFVTEWKCNLLHKPKLRTYSAFKHSFATELYVKQTMSRSRRSLLAQFRLGILPLEIETARYTPISTIKIQKRTERDISI